MEHPDYAPYPLRRPGPAQDDRRTDIPLDYKLREFNFASKSLTTPPDWRDIQAVAVSDSLTTGVIFVESEKGAVIVKGGDNVALGYFLSQLAQCLSLPVPQKRIVRWDSREFKVLTKELQRATFVHRELHQKVVGRLERPYLEVQEYIPGISLACMGKMRATKVLNFYDPTSRHRMIKLGCMMAFDMFINNPTRFPLEVWNNPIGDVEHMIVRTEPRYTDTSHSLRDMDNLSFEYEYIYGLDSHMFERSPGYYERVEEFLNKLFMELKSVMSAQLDPLYESSEARMECLNDFKRLVYDHTLYEMKEMSILQVLLGIVLTIHNIVEMDVYRLRTVLESVEVEDDWKDMWQINLRQVNMVYLESMMSIFKKFSGVYIDVIRYARDITLDQYIFDEDKYFDIVMMNPKIKERILKERQEKELQQEGDLMNEDKQDSDKDSEILEREIVDEELDKRIIELFLMEQQDKQKSLSQSQHSEDEGKLSVSEVMEVQQPKVYGGILVKKFINDQKQQQQQQSQLQQSQLSRQSQQSQQSQQ